MRSLVVLLVLFVACKKQEEPSVPVGSGGPPPSGHSVTKINDSVDGSDGSGAKAGSAGGHNLEGVAGTGSGVPADAKVQGGNGKPAYRDENGHLHGPGGPVFMGRGSDCSDKVDHCMRDGVWFAVGNIRPGSLFRATPVFEFENKWYTWRGDEAEYQTLLKTKLATKAELVPGNPVVWFIAENSSNKWVDNEMDALTSSRWECGVIEDVGADTFRVKGWEYGVPIETARIVIDKKES